MKKGLALLLLCFALAACNTVSGVGKDLQKAGESIQRSAD